MAASFARLPAEIQLLVLRRLGPRDLFYFMLCSRQLYNLVQPILYEELRLPKFPSFIWDPKGRDRFYKDREGRLPYQVLARLVQTLAQNPYLASRTTRLVCTSRWPDDWPTRSLEEDINQATLDEFLVERNTPTGSEFSSLDDGYDFALLQEKVKLVIRSEIEERIWMRDLRAGVPDAWIGLLLTLLPNLARLDIRIPRHAKYFPSLLRRASTDGFGSLQVLSSLSEVHAVQTDDDHSTGLANELFWVQPLFGIPSLRHFSFNNTYGQDGRKTDSERPDVSLALGPVTSSITHLEFWRCGVESGVLELTAACKSLKSFLYSRGGQSEDDAPWDPTKLTDPLSDSRKTLEILWFEVSPEDSLEFEEDEPRHYPSFKDFTSLKLLHVNAYDWFGSNSTPLPIPDFSGKLPSSLEVLHIADVEGRMVPTLVQGLETYVASHRHETPHLREIALSSDDLDPGRPRFSEVILDHLAGVPAACAEAGIQFWVDHEDGNELRRKYGVFKFCLPGYYVGRDNEYPVIDL